MFQVTFHARCRVPRGARPAILKAARAAAAGVPATVRKRLGVDGRDRWVIHVTLAPAAEIRKLNRSYRGKDKVTDVLSFPRVAPGLRPPVPEVGDVILCGSRAREQAALWGNTLLEELQRLTVHGVLHLFGYDHERSKRDEKIMFALQDRILKRL